MNEHCGAQLTYQRPSASANRCYRFPDIRWYDSRNILERKLQPRADNKIQGQIQAPTGPSASTPKTSTSVTTTTHFHSTVVTSAVTSTHYAVTNCSSSTSCAETSTSVTAVHSVPAEQSTTAATSPSTSTPAAYTGAASSLDVLPAAVFAGLGAVAAVFLV